MADDGRRVVGANEGDCGADARRSAASSQPVSSQPVTRRVAASRPRIALVALLTCLVALAAAAPSAARAQVDEDEVPQEPRRPQRIDMPQAGGDGGDAGGTDEGSAATVEPTSGALPRVYVIAVPMDDGMEAVAQRAGAAARHSLRERADVEWRAADALFLGYDESALEVLGRARAQLEQGRQAYLNLELAQAIQFLEAAVADFDAAAAALEDPRELGDALLFLGASLAFEGRARDATRVFARLHVQMPHVQPDPNLFNPDIVTRFEQARPRDAGDAGASIVIESDPPGAIAYVDFVARGVTPLTVTGLLGGEHVVRVTRAGATPFVQTVSVRPRRDATTSALLVDDPRTQGLQEALASVRTAETGSIAEGNAIYDVARILELDRVVVILASAGEGESQVSMDVMVFDVATGRRLVRGQGTAPTAIGELEPAVSRFVGGALEAAASLRDVQQEDDEEHIPAIVVDDTPPPPPPGEPSIAEQWWFWTIIGGVVVVGAVAVGVGVAVSDQGPGLGSDPQGQVVIEF